MVEGYSSVIRVEVYYSVIMIMGDYIIDHKG
jgi:hypothetical protein